MTITYLEDIDKISYRFTDLGKALAEVSAQNKESLQDTAKTLQDGFQSLSKDIWANEALKALNATPQALELSVLSVTKMFETLIAKADVSLGEFIRSAQVSKTSLDEFTKALLAEKAKASTPGQGDQSEEGGSEGGGKDTRKKREEKGKEKEKKQQLPKVIRQEINTLKSRFKGGLSKLKIPSPGQILGGSVAIMAYGYMEQDRMKKEAGEVKNALEGAVDAGMKGVLQTGTSRIAALQESLQKYSGIAKEESQAIAQTFAQGGVGIQEMLAGVDRSLGRVGKTAVHFTLGLDKMFEMSGGTTAQKVVGFMHNYGMSIKDASETVKDMYLNEQAMKIGAPTFVHNIESAAEAVKDFGFGIRGVMDIAGELQSAFDAVGVPKQFAGKLAGLGIQQMARGIASLSNDWKVLLGKNMGFSGEGTEVLQKVEEAFTRVKSGKSDEELKDLVLAMYNTAKSASEGDESRMYMMLSQKMEMGSYGARGIMEIGKAMEKGGAIEALKATKDHAKGLKDAFKTEAEKTGEFQRNMNKWMKGMSEVGPGLLGLVGKFLAYLIMMFRAFPSLLGASISRDFVRLRRMQLTINNTLGSFSPDIALLKSGVSKMGSAGKEMFGDVFASSIGAMESAFTADFSGEAPKSKSKSSDFTGERMPIVRTVVLPSAVGGEQRVELEAAAEEAAKEFASEHGQLWFGGGPILKNLGVNEHGGVQIALMGNCPRCGLIFGGGEGGSDSMLTGESTLGESLSPKSSSYFSSANEATIVSPNTGKSRRVDLNSPEALKDIRAVSLTGNMSRQISGAGKDIPNLDPDLLPMLQDLSKHYSGKDIKVYKSVGAGEKAHGQGKALDIGVEGVKKADLFKYLHSRGYGTKRGGLGYYTQAPFVHVDVRDKPAMWVDTSGSGESAQNVGNPTAWLQKNIGVGKV
jgi:hypothetical protein